MIQTFNPYNGAFLNEYKTLSENEIAEILNKVKSAFDKWRKTTFEFRSRLMNNAADILISRKEEFAVLMALEMGKPNVQGRAEIDKCALVCSYYAQNAESFLKPELIEAGFLKSYRAYNPLGAVFAIMPWNFPFWQVFRFAAPNLMAGNCGVLKHSSNTSGCSLAIESVFEEAGFPEYVFKSLIIKSDMAQKVIASNDIAAVTLTGSTPVGALVAESAGRYLKKCVLELGGSDPYIILEDADLDNAARICASGRLINSGQSCIAAKRFIVMESVSDEFTQKLAFEMSKYQNGDPLLDTTQIGPQARKDLQSDNDRQVKDSIAKGAKLVLGGNISDEAGCYYPPTILADVKPDMPAYNEELFGPVASVITVSSIEEAVSIANDTEFGLGAAVFSRDIEKAENIACFEINAGSCFVNDNVKSNPALPFGGIKLSGYGRELSAEGIKEFMNIKTIAVMK